MFIFNSTIPDSLQWSVVSGQWSVGVTPHYQPLQTADCPLQTADYREASPPLTTAHYQPLQKLRCNGIESILKALNNLARYKTGADNSRLSELILERSRLCQSSVLSPQSSVLSHFPIVATKQNRKPARQLPSG